MFSAQAIEVRDGIKASREIGKDAFKSVQEERYGDGLTLLESQDALLGQTETKADEMIDKAKEFEQRMSALNELCMRMDKLEVKDIESDSWKRQVEIFQTASDFENNLAAYLYPPHTSITFGPIFLNLMLWLDQNKNTPEGQEANNKWEEVQLKTQIPWTDEHENVLLKMLKCKMVIAAPEIDASSNNYEVNFSDEEIRLRGEIFKMHELIKPN